MSYPVVQVLPALMGTPMPQSRRYVPTYFLWALLPTQSTPGYEPFDVSLYTYLTSQLAYPVYPGHIPQSAALPAYSYFRVVEDPRYTLKSAAGLSFAEYQIDIWSLDYLECSEMELALRQALHGYRGMMGLTYVSSSRLQTTSSQTEVNVDGSDRWTQHYITEYRFGYRDLVPTF